MSPQSKVAANGVDSTLFADESKSLERDCHLLGVKEEFVEKVMTT